MSTKGEIPVPIETNATTAYKGRIIEVTTQKMRIGEREIIFEQARRSPGVRLIVTSSQGNILLTREFRNELQGYDYRLPGGKVFESIDEYSQALINGEDIQLRAQAAAQKEAQEEIGVDLPTPHFLYTSKCGATIEWDLLYFTSQLPTEELKEQHLEVGERIDVGWYSPDEALDLALNGYMSEDRSAAVLIRYIYSLQKPEYNKPPLNVGIKLARLLTDARLNSLKIRTSNLAQLKNLNSIVFVGSSFVGKSTLVDAIREALQMNPDLDACFHIPKRVITRPQRQNDNLIENCFRSQDDFMTMTQNGDVNMHWVRKMEGTRQENYGFLHTDTNKIPIYSANNAVLNNKESVRPVNLLETALIVAVYAQENVRARRLFDRSPDLVNQKQEEVAYRLADRAINMYPDAHLVVKNFGRYQDQTRLDVVDLIKLIAENFT